MGEIVRGLLLVPVVAIVMTLLINAIRAVFPALQTVDKNPLTQYMGTPLEASVFIVVVIIGAGIKEELQRAFILHRFEQRLGGIRVGLVFFSLLFAVLHVPQGLDAALAIGLLGVFWGVLYIRRQSAVMSITNHAGFDALQVALGHLFGST
jgi:membrane protease YdiL (CAAX protease family)